MHSNRPSSAVASKEPVATISASSCGLAAPQALVQDKSTSEPEADARLSVSERTRYSCPQGSLASAKKSIELADITPSKVCTEASGTLQVSNAEGVIAGVTVPTRRSDNVAGVGSECTTTAATQSLSTCEEFNVDITKPKVCA